MQYKCQDCGWVGKANERRKVFLDNGFVNKFTLCDKCDSENILYYGLTPF